MSNQKALARCPLHLEHPLCEYPLDVRGFPDPLPLVEVVADGGVLELSILREYPCSRRMGKVEVESLTMRQDEGGDDPGIEPAGPLIAG